ALLKGAPEVVLDKCNRWLENGAVQPLGALQRAHLVNLFTRLARRGERVLALAEKAATSSSIPQEDFVFVAVVGLTDPPRPEVEVAMARCRAAGIRVIMITGDHALTADSVARQIGLVRGYCRVVTGDELRSLSAGGLATVLEVDNVLFARTSPAQKLRIVQALQARNEIVAVTGDGVNDAPALKNADIGVAMGSGTEVAREAAKMVLLDDNFATIVSAIEEGRTIFVNIRKFIAYILTSNIPEILPFIAYVLLDIPLPLTVALILAIDLGTDILPALGLGAEQPESDVMSHPPRPRHERLLTRNLLFMSYAIVGTIQAAAGFFSFFFVLHDGGWSYGEALGSNNPLYRTAVTTFFASVVVCQIADVMICRTRHQSLFTIGVFSNRLVLLGVFVELALLGALSYVPTLNVVFGTAPLSWWHIALSVPFALFILAADELRRLLVRRQVAPVLRYLTW